MDNNSDIILIFDFNKLKILLITRSSNSGIFYQYKTFGHFNHLNHTYKLYDLFLKL